jgi:hypothetical protein
MKAVQEFCQKIGPDISGLIWLENDNYSPDLKYFNEMNYLLDGLLVENTKIDFENKTGHLFLSEQFGQPFFVIFFSSNNYSYQNLKDILKLAFDFNTKADQVLIFGEKDIIDSDVSKMKKSFADTSFSYLELQ